MSEQTPGTAYGDNPAYHHIRGGVFTCTAPADAPCRTHPTCDCEQWCCCDDPADHDDDEHCCMTTTQSGQNCWLEPWVSGPGLDDSFDHHDQASPAEYNTLTDEYTWPDGPVICDWDDGIWWRYVAPEALTGGDHG